MCPMKLEDIQAKFAVDGLKKHRIWAVLIAIFLIGFSIRYITHHDLLFDPDSYFWYRIAGYYSGVNDKFIAHNGEHLVDQLSYHPTGRNLGTDLLLLPMMIGYSYKLLGSLGLFQGDLMNYMFIIGPFFGSLTAVMTFFLVRELSSTKVAALSALFYSFTLQAMTRNTAGDTGQESLGGLFIFLWIYFFLKASKADAFSRRQLGLITSSMIFFSLARGTWGGNIFYTGLISTSVILFLLYKILSKDLDGHLENLSATYALVVIGGYILSYILVPIRYPLFFFGGFNLITFFGVFLSLVSIAMKKAEKYEIKPYNIFAGSMGAVFILVIWNATLFENVITFIENIYTGQGHNITGFTVAYYRMTSFEEFKRTFGVLTAAIPLGGSYLLYDFYKKRSFSSVLMIMWLLLGVVAYRFMIRLSYYLALVIPLTAFILIYAVFEYTGKPPTGKKSKKRANAQKPQGDSNFSKLAVGALLLLLLVPNLNSGIAFASATKYNDGGVKPWQDVGIWLKENTPEDALLMHWWDYGYHLQTFAERRTIVDGGNSGPRVPNGNSNRNIDVANMFTSTEDKTSEIIKLYNPENRPVYFLVSIEEFGKSGAINFHVNDQLFITSFTVPNSGNQQQDQNTIVDILARNRISSYYVINYGGHYQIWALIQMDQEGNYHPEWSEKLLAKLLPFNTGFGQGLKHLQMVYHNGYVYVYKYVE